MAFRIRTSAVALCLLMSYLPAGRAERYSFRHYGPAEGLTNVVVYALLQDTAGYVWAGTPNGLFRYDGSEFRRFDLAPTAEAPRFALWWSWVEERC